MSSSIHHFSHFGGPLLIVAVLVSCRSTVPSPDGRPIAAGLAGAAAGLELVADAPVEREPVGADASELVDARPRGRAEDAAVVDAATPSDVVESVGVDAATPTDPIPAPAPVLAPQPADPVSGGLLCCSESACVVPGPSDCHHQVSWCDHYTLTLDATTGIYVAHCQESTDP